MGEVSTGKPSGGGHRVGEKQNQPFHLSLIRGLLLLGVAVVLAISYGASTRAAYFGPGVGNIPQGTQTEDSFADSFAANHVTNVFATTQQMSCYTPEVPFTVSDGPVDWYTGETPCNGAATTGEDLGPYATQQGSNGGVPATAPELAGGRPPSPREDAGVPSGFFTRAVCCFRRGAP